MDFIYSIVEFFVQGGIFMYPILLVFAVGVAIACERYVTLTLLTKKNEAAWSQDDRGVTERGTREHRTGRLVAGLPALGGSGADQQQRHEQRQDHRDQRSPRAHGRIRPHGAPP